VPDLGLTLMPIAAGTFVMGHDSGDTNERPLTRVTLTKPFWLGRTEVTQREWKALMGETDRSYFKDSNLPVQNVSWDEAMEFCRKLTATERRADRLPAGYIYSLPTEAEWEFGCRAGTTNEFSGKIGEMAWHEGNSGNTPHAAATLAANAWGLHDMHGNVWEWCADFYQEKLKGGSVSDPAGPANSAYRVRRGGSWVISAGLLRSSIRGRAEPDYRNYNLGFRIALVPAR
jgi:formylglycine-generating enzyme required for sulfatase activity